MHIRNGIVGLVYSLATGYFCLPQAASAQAESSKSLVPLSGWYVSMGAGYNSVEFGDQRIYADATTHVSVSGLQVLTGTVSGSGTLYADTQSAFAPSVQGGYFKRSSGGKAIWGVALSETYLGTTSSTSPVYFNVFGTSTSAGNPQPLSTIVTAQSYEASIEHQLSFLPTIGHTFDRGFVYIGAGPTLSQVRTRFNAFTGFAVVESIPGFPGKTVSLLKYVDASASSWVWGGAAVIGATYFLDRSWFLDVSYSYARTSDHTGEYFTSYSEGGGLSTTSGTLLLTSEGKVIAQGITMKVSVAL
jgi:opacity protein-like surface antigen